MGIISATCKGLVLVGLCASPACLVDADALSRGNPEKGACERHEQCDPGLVCEDKACAYPRSCLALKTSRPSTPSGNYELRVNPTSTEPPLRATCEMTTAGGGWLLVTPAMVSDHKTRNVTLQASTASDGGLDLKIFANARGCGETNSFHIVLFNPPVTWTQIRMQQAFAGTTQCYSILGSERFVYLNGTTNLNAFDPAQDTVLKQVNMGPIADAFPGTIDHCDNNDKHFWNRSDAGLRSIEAILRRNDLTKVAGLSTGVSCTIEGPADGSPTWWRFSQIYVR